MMMIEKLSQILIDGFVYGSIVCMSLLAIGILIAIVGLLVGGVVGQIVFVALMLGINLYLVYKLIRI